MTEGRRRVGETGLGLLALRRQRRAEIHRRAGLGVGKALGYVRERRGRALATRGRGTLVHGLCRKACAVAREEKGLRRRGLGERDE